MIKKPLNDFLKYEIDTITIQKGSSGCSHYRANTIVYTLKNKKYYTVSSHKIRDVDGSKKEGKFRSKIKKQKVIKLLREINEVTDKSIILSDFQMSWIDKLNYRRLILRLKVTKSYFNSDNAKKYAIYATPHF